MNRPSDTAVLTRMNAALDQLAELTDAPALDVPETDEPFGRRSDHAPPSRRWVAQVAAAALVVAVGAAVVVRDSPADQRATVAPVSPGQTITDPSAIETYDLDLAGATLVEDEIVTATTATGAIWPLDDGSWLYLTIRPGGADAVRADPGSQPIDADLPGDVMVPTSRSEPRRSDLDPADLGMPALEVRWARPDGDAWLLTQYFPRDLDVDRLVGWLDQIEPTADGGPPGARRGLSDGAGNVETRARRWEFGSGTGGALVAVSGAAAARRAALFDMAAGPPAPVAVAGTVGVRVRLSTGDRPASNEGTPVVIQWAMGDGRTATVWLPGPEREPEVLDALRPVVSVDDGLPYRVVEGDLTIGTDGQGTITAGAEDGVRPGHGVYRSGGLVGVVDFVHLADSDVVLLTNPSSVVPASLAPEDGADAGSIGGTVHGRDGEIVFVPDGAVAADTDLTGRDLVVLGGPGHPRLQFKTPIGTIAGASAGTPPAWPVTLAGTLDDGPATVIATD